MRLTRTLLAAASAALVAACAADPTAPDTPSAQHLRPAAVEISDPTRPQFGGAIGTTQDGGGSGNVTSASDSTEAYRGGGGFFGSGN